MIVDRLNATIARLSRRPRIGRVQKNWEGEPHVFGVRPWIVVYEPFREGDGIHILRILDSRQDLLAMLGKKT
jgi:plasmid stabilization system protein ParE